MEEAILQHSAGYFIQKKTIAFISLCAFCLASVFIFQENVFETKSQSYGGQNESQELIQWMMRDKVKGHVLDISKLQRPQYLQDFKNPCWKNNGGNVQCFPYFFTAGFPKCGTSDLWKMVSSHPEIVLPKVKEIEWWPLKRFNNMSINSYIQRFDKPALEIQQHATQRAGKSFHRMITGDGSVHIAWDNKNWKEVPQNKNCTLGPMCEPVVVLPHLIRHLIPQSKIIFTMRNPVDRIYSGYLFWYMHNRKSKEEFHKVCVEAIQSWKICITKYSQRRCAFDGKVDVRPRVRLQFRTSLYVIFLRDWLKVYPREQLHFIKFEEYAADRKKILNGFTNFLGLEPHPSLDKIVKRPIYNSRPKKSRILGPMLSKTRAMLVEFFLPYNKELSQLLQDDKFMFA